MARIVYLFLDTNVLVQCRPLDQVDWSGWKDFDEVHLVISRPVQAEIDDQKNKGWDRLAKRAKAASSKIRGLITGDGHLLVKPTGPTVKLLLDPRLRPSEELAGDLDYSLTDDQLVGLVHAFAKQNEGADARVLTHDTGPMATAKMVGVAFVPVPDEWLLPPEPSESDRRIRTLEAEVARLKDTEPKFTIACVDAHGNELERLEFEVALYEAISDGELNPLLDQLKQRHPLATDFGPREPAEREAHGLRAFMGGKEVFTPASDKEIQTYREDHAKWLKNCEAVLRDLHGAMQRRDGPPTFVFAATNCGTRPASDALIIIKARGRFEIMPPPYRPPEDDDLAVKKETPVELPRPPSAPRGTWKTLTS